MINGNADERGLDELYQCFVPSYIELDFVKTRCSRCLRSSPSRVLVESWKS